MIMHSYFLFNLCFVIYTICMFLFIGYTFYKKENIAKIAKYLLIISFIIHTIGMIYKTQESGHAPFVNMYESLIFFTWAISLFYIFLEYKYRIKTIGVVIIPLIVLGLGYSKSISSDPEPLIPALQSVWLEIHVATSFIGYAAFAVAYGVGLMSLLKTPKESDKLPSKFTVFNVAFTLSCLLTFIGGVIINFVEKINGVLIYPEYNINKERISQELFGFALSYVILFSVFFISFFMIFFICYFFKEKFTEKLISLFSELNISIVCSAILYYIIYAIFHYYKIQDKFSALQLLVFYTILCVILFFIVLFIFIIKREKIESYLPDLNTLDSIIFISIAFGFPFLTSGIITGAIWANSAWGTYWGWDPKETWSLITWFIYAAYLHARYTKGWRDAKASYLAVYGFIAVIFTYFGVNLFFAGLHSYAVNS